MSRRLEPQIEQVVRDAHVLMVDDEPINMDVLRIHLESEGYQHFTALSDATRALETIQSERPDVVLLDLMMPEVSGFDILELLRSRAEFAQLPVIVLTSSNDPATKLQALELGATDFLAKPVDASELALRMRNTLTARAWQKRRSRLDSLTDLPNESCFLQLLERAVKQDPEASGLLLLVNIIGFKAINDSLGNAGGDEVLWLMRERLTGIFGRNPNEVVESLTFGSRRGAGCVARLGRDRFAVYLPDEAAEDPVATTTCLIHEFNAAFEKPVCVEGSSLVITPSVGVAPLNAGTSVSAALSAAETAMAHARDAGDGGFRFYAPEMDARARERLGMQSALRTAIADDGLFLVYQPKIEIATGRICGAEALLRWKHPRFGLISPVDFIPMAEDSGDIVAIGEWVLREACRQTRVWQRNGHADVHMAVNVSIRQLRDAGFMASVKQVIDDTGIDARHLVLELTENMIMENAEANIGKLDELRALGLSLSIDDFGTGYSSLAYLQRFPITQLKIDQSFVREIQLPEDSVPIIKAVVSLAHDLGLEVVAEGVETPAQLARLSSLGCEMYQGYLMSRPVIAARFEELLATGSIDRAA